jgi:GT2 family glycosyltransferase
MEVAQGNQDAVYASLVLDVRDPDRIWWAGSSWRRLAPLIPVMTSRYLFPAGTPVSSVPDEPYESDEAHGRAVLVPRALFEQHGLFDEERLPHYGADIDFSLRLRAAHVPIHIVPRATVTLEVEHSGQAHSTGGLWTRLTGIWRYLTEQKSGDAIRVWWLLTHRHAPLGTRNLTFLFVIGLNLMRRLGLRRRQGRS